MIHVRAHLGMSVDKVFFTKQNGLYSGAKGGWDEWGKVRRTRMHQGSHPGNLSQRRPGSTPGRAQNLGQIQMYFFWPGMKKQVFRWVKACLGCRSEKHRNQCEPASPKHSWTHMQTKVVAMDFLGPFLEIDQRKQVHFHNDRHFQKVASRDPSPRQAELDGCECQFSNLGFAKKGFH